MNVTTMPATEGNQALDAKAPAARLTPMMLNHAAWVTHDVAATAKFYIEVMGMDLASTVYDDTVPSTGDAFPYFHIFFRMQDGSTIAFFEAPGLPERAEPPHPAYSVFDHIALQAESKERVEEWYEWLKAKGVDVIGPVDHKGLIYSVYFHDPNGLRLEITTPLSEDWNDHSQQGHADLELWVKTKENARARGEDVVGALVTMIRQQRQRYD